VKRCLSPIVLIWFVAIALSSIFGYIAFDRVQVERNEARADVQRENDILCRAFEQDVSRSVASIDTMLLFLKAHYEKDYRVTEDIQSMLKVLRQRPIFQIVGLVDAQGFTIASTEPVFRPLQVGDLPHIALHRTTSQADLHIGKPTRGRTTGTVSIPLTRRLNNPDGSFAGVVFAGVNPDYFSSFYEGLELGPSHGVSLIGLDGIIRARYFNQNREIGQSVAGSQLFRLLPSQPVGSYASPGVVSSQARLISYRKLPLYPLIVTVGVTEEHALAEVEQRKIRYYSIAGLFVVLLLGAAYSLTLLLQRNNRLLQQTNLTLLELKNSSAQTIQTLASITEKHDPYAAGHQRKTTELAVAIGKQLSLSAERIGLLSTAAALHDVGKIAIPGEILSKPALLSPIEHDLVKLHVSEGVEILRSSGLPKTVITAVLQHHERLDGSGYPLGLCETQISLEAKILAVADSMEAMLSHRPYRVAMTVESALNELISLRDSHYDPAVVEACIIVFRQQGFTFATA